MPKSKFLIIDDEPLILSSISSILTDEYEVITAGDGINGLDEFIRHRPSAVLIDINMPVPDGMEILKMIRKIDALVPVVMMSGNACIRVDELKKMTELGVRGYLTKPFTPQDLLQALDEGTPVKPH